MSEDRKLLEDAARAAGYNVRAVASREQDGTVSFYMEPDSLWWNPLVSDADAFQLAVRLGLIVDTHGMHTRVQLPYEGEALCHEPHGTDPYAATRRAITRAAAAMAPTPTEDAR